MPRFRSQKATRNSRQEMTAREAFTHRPEVDDPAEFSPSDERAGYEEYDCGGFQEGIKSAGSLVGQGTRNPPRIATTRRGKGSFDGRKGNYNHQPVRGR